MARAPAARAPTAEDRHQLRQADHPPQVAQAVPQVAQAVMVLVRTACLNRQGTSTAPARNAASQPVSSLHLVDQRPTEPHHLTRPVRLEKTTSALVLNARHMALTARRHQPTLAIPRTSSLTLPAALELPLPRSDLFLLSAWLRLLLFLLLHFNTVTNYNYGRLVKVRGARCFAFLPKTKQYQDFAGLFLSSCNTHILSSSNT